MVLFPTLFPSSSSLHSLPFSSSFTLYLYRDKDTQELPRECVLRCMRECMLHVLASVSNYSLGCTGWPPLAACFTNAAFTSSLPASSRGVLTGNE